MTIKDPTISQLDNEQILSSIESVESSGDDENYCFGFSINKTFFIYVRAGLRLSYPEEMLKNVDDLYKKINSSYEKALAASEKLGS